MKEQVYVIRVDNRADVYCCRLSVSDFIYSILSTLGFSSMFSIFISNGLHSVVADEIIYPRLLVSIHLAISLDVPISDGTQVFNQWRHIRGSREDTLAFFRGKHSLNISLRVFFNK